MAQIWHTRPQKTAKMQNIQQLMQSIKSFNFRLLRIVAFCGVPHNITFVMRRSSVRFWLWAITLNPIRTSSYGVLRLSVQPTFAGLWHTNGTLDHKKLQSATCPKSQLTCYLALQRKSQILSEFLFKCAIRVPRHSPAYITPLKISNLQRHSIALNMRCCGFWAHFVCFCEFLKETNR